ncbi:MAG: ACT domain-containing protein [Pseudomonadales bacterium]
MAGEKHLDRLLSVMSPTLSPEEFVFCSYKDASYGDHRDLAPIASISEREGLTLVITRASADEQKIEYESVFKRISLNVHSSLDAVGLTAAFSSKLASHGISANVIAGYFHDHIFVQSEQAEAAVAALNEFSG